MHPVSGGKPSKLSVEDDEKHWYEDKVRLSRHEDLTHFDLRKLLCGFLSRFSIHAGLPVAEFAHFAYPEHELAYPPPPSYSVATSIEPSHTPQLAYPGDFSPLHHEQYVLHSTPRALTPHLDFSSSPDSSPLTPRMSSALDDSHLSPRYAAVMSGPHCLIPVSMPGSRPVTPMGVMPLPLPAYLTEFPEPYHHQGSGKVAYSYSVYEPATGVHGIHG
jgi:hypothetical protein